MKLELSREELISVAAALQERIAAQREMLLDERRLLNATDREMLRHSHDRLTAVQEKIALLFSKPRHIDGEEE